MKLQIEVREARGDEQKNVLRGGGRGRIPRSRGTLLLSFRFAYSRLKRPPPPFVIIRRAVKFTSGSSRDTAPRHTPPRVICRSLPALSRYLSVAAVVSHSKSRNLRSTLSGGDIRESNNTEFYADEKVCIIFTVVITRATISRICTF